MSQPQAKADDDILRARRLLLNTLPVRSSLLAALHRLQDAFGEIRPEHFSLLAHACGISLAEVFETASFYDHFTIARQAPRVRVCRGPACRMATSARLAEAGDPAASETGCIGACDYAPAALIDGLRVAPYRGGRPTPSAVLKRLRNYDPAPPIEPDADLRHLLDELDAAGLGGMSGAGFSVAGKWRLVSAESGPRYVILNADEGEPGSFKDRHLLETAPAQVLAAALTAAHFVGAEEVHVYLRNEYKDLLPSLTAIGGQLEASWRGARFEWHRGAGSYVCGEETALIESLEGRPGRPRHKPPYPSQAGLRGRPTLVQNVETLFWVGEIAARGGAWYASHGRRGRRGQRFVSISGRVKQPGVYSVPLGLTLDELVAEFADGMADGHRLAAFLPNGASGGILPASAADSVLDNSGLAPHGAAAGCGAVIVLSEKDDLLALVQNLMAFLAHESCGQCAPCRLGTVAAARRLAHDAPSVVPLEDLATSMAYASICGLGQGAGRMLETYIRHFGSDQRR